MAKPDEKTKEPTATEGAAASTKSGPLAPSCANSSGKGAADPTEKMKKLALGRGIQSLWAAVLPMVGVKASRPGEFPGVFQVEPGEGPHEALIHIDIPSAPYEAGEKPKMGRVVSLSVTLAHDFRRLGDRYYCIDCEVPAEETRH